MLRDLNNEPSGKFENFCRMSSSDFEYILNKIGPVITKLDTNMRKAIPAQERLAITLRFLASGDSFVSLSYLFKVSNQCISTIVREVCDALIKKFKDEIKVTKYLKLKPSSLPVTCQVMWELSPMHIIMTGRSLTCAPFTDNRRETASDQHLYQLNFPHGWSLATSDQHWPKS
ncbi:protein ANTAGONIST OF LIKE HETEROCHROMATIN PROTEIN 1-like [Aphis craccivora]|uniref:Protein ANTAGONIST OF LIKE HETEROCHROMATIN PROTEIN 1-like n=1 Tax=Aphis craccivora TaxID=307492 RepID=A0A6G0VUA5_APHCR|nr:protein ANTAGONIST OF LIKE HETEROCHROMATIN PROTEIN 1-like [Aphis craccivora]